MANDILEYDRMQSVLVLLHVQNDTVQAEGVFGRERRNDRFRLAQRQSVRALTAARAWAMDVVHVGLAFSDDYHEINPSSPFFQQIRDRKGYKRGSWGADFIESLKPLDSESVIWNTGLSAFAGGKLAELAAQRNWTTLVLCGITTNGVVESTARRAIDDGYRVIVISDACVSSTEETDRVSLEILANIASVEPVMALETALRNARAVTTRLPSPNPRA